MAGGKVKMKINIIALSICGGSLILFIAIMIFYAVKIQRLKKTIQAVPKARGSYWGVLVSAVILVLLPILVPMKTYFIAIVCCCAIMAEIIAYRDRLDQLAGKS
jgi:hypothetical protein